MTYIATARNHNALHEAMLDRIAALEADRARIEEAVRLIKPRFEARSNDLQIGDVLYVFEDARAALIRRIARLRRACNTIHLGSGWATPSANWSRADIVWNRDRSALS